MRFLLLLTLLVSVSLPLRAAPIEIKFAHVVSEDTPKGLMANRFRELVKERFGDQIEVKVFPNASLYNDSDVVPAMLAGNVQMAAPSLSKFTHYTQALQVFDLPFLFKDMKAVERFQNSREGRKLLGALKLKGIIGHGYLHNGMKQLSATQALRIPADASGLRFRIQSSDVLQAQFEAINAIPVRKPFSQVYSLLREKTLDGQENTWSNIHSKRFFEVQPFITESNHGVLDYLVVTSAEFWLGLDRKLRRTLEKTLHEAIAYGNEMAAKKAAADRQTVIDSGRTELITLTDSERRQWVEAMKPVWDQFSGSIGMSVIRAAEASNH